MKLSDFNYYLPEELIAQSPADKRDESRLLVLDRKTGKIEHRVFKDIIEYISPKDCLVINETKVIPARIYGSREGKDEKIEMLLLKDYGNNEWEVLVKPGKKCKIGTRVYFKSEDEVLLTAEVIDIFEDGNRKVKLKFDGILNEILDKIGVMPLPPYIHEKLKEKDRYQTVYAKVSGSSAAPTAGLHFTKELLQKIQDKGVRIAKVTLHVGLGTFRPVNVEDVTKHVMHKEHYIMTKEAADTLNEIREKGGKIYAVGTTSVRTLETIMQTNDKFVPASGDTSIFIYPGFKFKGIDGLITNFHLPKSTLVMLVSAFSSKENILNAYNEAVKMKYRFFSFGDAMLIK